MAGDLPPWLLNTLVYAVQRIKRFTLHRTYSIVFSRGWRGMRAPACVLRHPEVNCGHSLTALCSCVLISFPCSMDRRPAPSSKRKPARGSRLQAWGSFRTSLSTYAGMIADVTGMASNKPHHLVAKDLELLQQRWMVSCATSLPPPRKRLDAGGLTSHDVYHNFAVPVCLVQENRGWTSFLHTVAIQPGAIKKKVQVLYRAANRSHALVLTYSEHAQCHNERYPCHGGRKGPGAQFR